MARHLSHALRRCAQQIPRTPSPPQGRRASIAAVLWLDEAGTESLLFIKRAVSPRDPWSGNIAMPGGRADPEDDDNDEATAMREAREEVGLRLEDGQKWERLGRLTQDRTIYPRGRPMLVSMFGFVHVGTEQPPLAPSADECAYAWWVPTETLRPDQLVWQQRALTELFPAPTTLTARCVWGALDMLGLRALRYASIQLPPPPSAAAPHADQPTADGQADERFVLWGITLAFTSDMLERAAAMPLIGPKAAPEFRQAFHATGGVIPNAALSFGWAARSSYLSGRFLTAGGLLAVLVSGGTAIIALWPS